MSDDIRTCGAGAPCEQTCPLLRTQAGQECPTLEVYFEGDSALAA